MGLGLACHNPICFRMGRTMAWKCGAVSCAVQRRRPCGEEARQERAPCAMLVASVGRLDAAGLANQQRRQVSRMPKKRKPWSLRRRAARWSSTTANIAA